MASAGTTIELVIERGQCIGCAICADVCPCTALVIGATEAWPTWRPEQCNACGDCARECPTAAITLRPETVLADS